MKINSDLSATVLATNSRVGSRVKSSASSAEEAADVKLSTMAADLATAESEPPIDAARVAEIKKAIAEGRFEINASAIADSLIATARGLLKGQIE